AGFGPQVSFARSGGTLPWDAKYQSLLELAEACDVPVRWSCRTGGCHTCETALIAGDVDYDPQPLDPPAQGDALICCSRPRGAVVLDLWRTAMLRAAEVQALQLKGGNCRIS